MQMFVRVLIFFMVLVRLICFINLSQSQKLARTPDFSGKGQNSTEAGGTLCNLGYLSSLVELNLCGNSFTNIPAARISDLTELLAQSSPWTWLIQLWNNMLKSAADPQSRNSS
ncbi:hypothetical protein MTR67_053611 [Solanum verrucosum]|uniref:Uncharacterized protein n=1 Tax=Solanum verrucosum TaxID=315347 RepID=A0AAF1A245_SOLVR|nr:hypothetical protein MTR67_053611 [Solanum verrucosum]